MMQGLDPPGGMMDLVRLQSPVRSPCQEGADLPWRHSRTCLDPRSSGSEGPQWEQAKQLRADALPSAWCQEAWGEAADSLVASELATIYQLVKAKSDRILGKEKELQRSECMVAQVVGAAKARLRADVEDLLRISKQELRKEANLQKKRLEELFQKAQDEFRKAVTWRKEARALKGAVDLERDNHEKLQKKIQELVRREKALRQQHAEEKERWAQEKEQLERRLALQNGVPAQESRIALRPKDGHFGRPVPKTVGAAPPDIADIQDHRRSLEEAVQFQAEGVETAAGRMESWNASTIGEGDPNPCSRCTHGTSVPQKPDAEISQCQLALWSAWWGVNSMVFGPRGLWGCAALLSAEPSRSQDPENWFLRRWVWHALLADATSMWQSASDKVQEEKKTSSRDVPPLRMEPFDLQHWLPQGRQRPFTRLRQHLQPHLVAESSEATKAGNKVLWLLPASSQQKVAGALWKDARQQLLSSEKALRLGKADPSVLAQAARSLLSVAALSVETAAGDAEAALRALTRLCAGHSEELSSALSDALPVLLWLVDATGATGRCTPKGNMPELTAKILQELGPSSLRPGNPVTVHFLAAALLRVPVEAASSKPTWNLLPVMAELLHKAAESVVTKLEKSAAQLQDALERRSLRAWRGPLRRWLDRMQEAGTGSRNSPLAAWVSSCAEVLGELPLY